MRLTPMLLTLCASSVLAAPKAEDPCPLSEAKVTEPTSMKVLRKELPPPSTFGAQPCVYTLESGTLIFSRVYPRAKGVKTEAELAAHFAEDMKRYRRYDFSVPAYSFLGGVYLVLPAGVWHVNARRGDNGDFDPIKICRAVIEAKKAAK
jgi:hypothetical protein